MAVIDVFGRKLSRCGECGRSVLHAVVALEARFQAFKNLDGFSNRRLGDVDFLEPAGKRMIFFEHATIFGVGCCADALQLPGRQGGLQQVRRVERAPRGRTGTNERMNFIDEQNGIRIFHQLFQHRFQALFEIAAIFRSRKQRAHVERIDLRFGEDVRHLAIDDTLGQTLGDGGLADTSFTDQ